MLESRISDGFFFYVLFCFLLFFVHVSLLLLWKEVSTSLKETSVYIG